MYTISIKHKNKGEVTYNVYKRKEADKESIEYRPWKEAEIGEYALSDDGYVAMVIQKKEYPFRNGKNSTYIRLPWGYCFFTPESGKQLFNIKGRKTNHTFSGKSQLKVRSKQKDFKDLAMAYAHTFDFNAAIDMVFDKTTPKDRFRWRRNMKTEVFRNMVRDELKVRLQEHEMDENFTLELMKDIIQRALKKNDISNLNRILENLQAMHGMNDKKVEKTTETLEVHSTRKLIDDLATEEKDLVATKEVKIEKKDIDE
jgi:hypothetical protein